MMSPLEDQSAIATRKRTENGAKRRLSAPVLRVDEVEALQHRIGIGLKLREAPDVLDVYELSKHCRVSESSPNNCKI